MSSIKLCFVAVNFGGSCGGVLYCFGAIVELVRGLTCCANGLRSGVDLKYCAIFGGRTPSRREARMAERVRKKATAANRTLVREREEATMNSRGAGDVVTSVYVRMSGL